MPVNAIDYSTLTVAGTAVGLDSASPALTFQKIGGVRVKGAIITVEDADIRYRTDGTAPTSSEGHPVFAGDIIPFDCWTSGQDWTSEMNKIKFIRTGSTSAALKITWYSV